MRIIVEYLEPGKPLRGAGIEDMLVFLGSARIKARDDVEAALKALSADASANDLKRANSTVEMSKYYVASRELTARLTVWAQEFVSNGLGSGQHFSVITGGGPGIMDAVNRGAEEVGGTTISMNISLLFEQYPNEYIADGLVS
jgi:predicted Rossmann-fold nucleotide-binding protein